MSRTSSGTPRLSLQFFGQFQVQLDGKPVTAFNSDKTRALLMYLTLESNRAHRRESLSGLLWPNVLDTSARQSLSQSLSILRKLLPGGEGEGETRAFIVADREAIQFNPNSDYALDVRQLETLANVDLGNPAGFAEAERILGLYRAPLLEGFTIPDAEGFEEWLLLRRESLQRVALEAFDKAVAAATARGDYAKAIELARRQLEIDPWREETHRDLMLAYAFNGQRADALAQFEKCRQILRDALGIDPSAETRALWTQIQREELRPADVAVIDADAVAITLPNVASLAIAHLPQQQLPPLPVSATPFVGREAELAELAALIVNPEVRLITLMGAGGAGKTRLALQAATVVQSEFEFGAAFVPLVSITTSEQIAPAIATALNVPLQGEADDLTQLLTLLREKSVLIVLDNFEHLLSASGSVDVAAALLRAAPRVKLLVTSREALNIASEWVRDVGGLGKDAHALFVQSARRVYAQSALTAEDEIAIDRICRLVEGMPLGIELAASWTRLLSCADIADEIARNIDFLATTTRDVPARHRSITAVFDYSWKLLTPREQQVMMHLSVFRGGFTRDAAKQVAGASLLELSALISKSLVRRAAAGRYDLHELVRQYAAAQLAETQDVAHSRERHLAFYAALAEATEPRLLGEEQASAWVSLESELDNIRAALDWAVQPSQPDARGVETALRLLVALRELWRVRGHLGEARTVLGQLLFRSQLVPLPLRARALNLAGVLALGQDDLAVARVLFEESLEVWQHVEPGGAGGGTAQALLGLGEAASGISDYISARDYYERSYALFEAAGDAWGMSEALLGMARQVLAVEELPRKRELLERSYAMKRALGDARGMAWVLSWLGVVAHQFGDMAQAHAVNLECLALQQTLGDKPGMARTLNRIGEVMRHDEKWAEASAYYTESLQHFRELGSTRGIAMVLHNLAHILLRQNEASRALAYFKESLMLYDQHGDKEGLALALAGLGAVALVMGQPQLAVRRLSAAAATMRHIGYFFETSDNEAYEGALAAAKAALSEEAFASAWAAGEAMPLLLMVAESLKG